jgi:hypothetical protein
VIGQHCEHERITRAAFACPPNAPLSDGSCFEERTLHQLAGTSEPEGYVGQGSNGAVGAPDMLDPVPEGPEAHCDNADFLDSVGLGLNKSYPQSREQATQRLQECANHLRLRFSEGLAAAERIVDQEARIVSPEVDIASRDCTFSFPRLQMYMFSRGKCSAIEGFGRALHGVQDFYAHSNWADDAVPPYGPDNPPGLLRDDYPLFLDLRAENNISDMIPFDLSTGCFGGLLTDGPIGKAGHPLEPGSLDCTGRITHHTLNKDNGIIDGVTGKTTAPGPNTPRSDHAGNFQRAVTAAIRDSRRAWRHFREEIRRSYGTERGNMIICALVRDNPSIDCYGRRVAIIRSTKKNENPNRVAEMQMPVHKWLLEELSGRAHDEGPFEGITEHNTTKSRGSSDELHKPLVYSEHDQSREIQVTSRDLDFDAALTELRTNTPFLPSNKTSVIALTSMDDPPFHEQLRHIWRAGDESVRAHLGLLPPSPSSSSSSPSSSSSSPSKKEFSSEAERQDMITAILRTGGTYSTLHSSSSIPSFISHVISRGLTTYDNAPDTATLLLPGLSIADYVTPESEPRRYSFDAHAFDNVVISVAPISPRLSLHVAVRHVRRNMVVQELRIGLDGNETFRSALGVGDIPRTDAWFECEVRHVEGDGLVGSGLFEVGIETEGVGKNGEQQTRGSGEDADNRHDEL